MALTAVSKDELPQLLAAVKRLTKRQCLVGVPEASAMREPDPDHPDEDANNAMLAYVHEFGEPEKNIPARPFLEPGIANASEAIIATLKKAGQLALRGQLDEIDKSLNKVGLLAVDAVQQKIEDGPFEPLKPRTLAARKARGVTREKPLIDTGALQASITYVLRDRDKNK